MFQQWVNMVYNGQQAKAVVGGQESETISIGRGVRQRCLISPLLFDLAIATLAISVRDNEKIHGVKIMSLEIKLSLYADDVILFLQNPAKSLDQVNKLLDDYSLSSSYKVNEKTVIMGLNVGEGLKSRFHLNRVETEGIRYSGIRYSDIIQDMVEENFLAYINTLKNHLGNWQKLKISWWGCMAVIKLKILPGLVFLFQNLMIHIPMNLLIRSRRC